MGSTGSEGFVDRQDHLAAEGCEVEWALAAHDRTLHEAVYTVVVKNVTISLPESVWAALRDRAKDHQKSLNAFIGEVLVRETSGDAAWLRDFEAATEAHSVEAGNWTWSREDTYSDRLS